MRTGLRFLHTRRFVVPQPDSNLKATIKRLQLGVRKGVYVAWHRQF